MTQAYLFYMFWGYNHTLCHLFHKFFQFWLVELFQVGSCVLLASPHLFCKCSVTFGTKGIPKLFIFPVLILGSAKEFCLYFRRVFRNPDLNAYCYYNAPSKPSPLTEVGNVHLYAKTYMQVYLHLPGYQYVCVCGMYLYIYTHIDVSDSSLVPNSSF